MKLPVRVSILRMLLRSPWPLMLRLKYSALEELVLALFAALLVVVVMMFTPGEENSDGETFIPDG